MDMDANNLLELPIQNKGWLDEMNDEGGMYHCTAEPVSQLFSFRLYCDVFEQREKCEVYGDINIEDVYGTTFEIYHVDSDDPAILTCEYNSLDIFFPCDCAASYIWARMVIRFFDRADGSPIVDNVLNFDRVDIGGFDRHKIQRVDGANGHALVSFATFSKAIFALVGIKLVKNDKSNALQDPPRLNGRIVARCGNTYGEKYPGIMLFDDPPPESTRVEFDSPIELLRDMVVVPAYSFLRIDIGLFDASTSKSLGNHKVEFLATHVNNGYGWRNIEAGDFIIRVDLTWVHPYEEERHSEKLCKRPKVCTYVQVPNISREPKCDPHGFSLLEVFAVMIGHNISSVLNISGSMRVKDYRTHRLVFNRKGSNPHILSSESKTIPIEGPTECISAREGLVMTLDLCDVYNEVSIKGSVVWGFPCMDIPIVWYNRRICSVCRGFNGYAAIFYTLFSRAVQAHVEVSLLAGNSLDTKYHHVDGTILASYTNEDYSTKFEKTYYKSVLFNDTEGVKLGCRIPLLKSVVAVPVDASLIVEVDLNAKSAGEHWEHIVEIDIDDHETNDAPSSKLIKGKNYDIQVSVVWSKLYQWTH